MQKPHIIPLCLTLGVLILASGCSGVFNRKGGGAGGNGQYGDGIGTGDPLNPDGIEVGGEFFPGGSGLAPFDETRTAVAQSSTGLETVYFTFDSSTLPPQELVKIDQAGDYLRSNPKHVMIIEGHCDERGSNEYNLSLGEQRAQSIRTYLIALGIAADRLQTRSYGEEKPAVMGVGDEIWALNRRGEFAVFK